MKKCFFTIAVCLITSCGNINHSYDVEVIDINRYFDVNQLDEIRTKYAYDGFVVKLETTDDCLLGLYDGKYYFSENRIYIAESTIFIFDFDGKFINKLKLGNGHGEIANYQAVDYDCFKNELIVYQEPYIKYYSCDGIFLREKQVPYYFRSLKSVSEGYILQCDSGNMGCDEAPDATLLFVDKDFNLISANFNVIKKAVYYHIDFIYHSEKENITIVPINNDTIYQLVNNSFVPIYYLDYTLDRFDNTITNTTLFFKENSRHYSWSKYIETSTHQFFSLSKKTNFSIFRDKLNGIIKGGIYSNFNSLFSIAPITTYGDYFVSCKNYCDMEGEDYEILSMFSEEDIKKINDQKEDDNPLLIFYKLKPFDYEE